MLPSAAISTRLTASHPNSEVKLVRAGVVLRWGTTREGPVLRFCDFFSFFFSFGRCAEGPAALLPFHSFILHRFWTIPLFPSSREQT